MPSSAADGGRRSRRGYAYQDAVTLLDCLDLHQGHCTEVGFEDLDDIVVVSASDTIYRQVKTSEQSHRHTIASVCAHATNKTTATSILGRLFTGKELSNSTRFCLTVNETPGPDLHAFYTPRGQPRPRIPSQHKTDIVERLGGLTLPAGYTVEWCVDRFEVAIEPRTIESVEDACLRRLAEPVTHILGQKPLAAELEDILLRLAQSISRDAMRVEARRWDRAFMQQLLEEAVMQVAGRTASGNTAPLKPLVDKLQAARVPLAEAVGQRDALLLYRRQYRAALSSRRSVLDSLNDAVFAVCQEVSARRRAGLLAPGAAAYAETVSAVHSRDLHLSTPVTLAERSSALADVTARCQNRYVEEEVS